ncbi:hypothetical protein [Hugenholtzia roseola]|uniref:hypothetical protein n=1 Tax=Hugenholtzia roseola TaxID=1002 RepID=UPI000479F4DC|nr:hypothetical protein [Hugenholtzia roseola]
MKNILTVLFLLLCVDAYAQNTTGWGIYEYNDKYDSLIKNIKTENSKIKYLFLNKNVINTHIFDTIVVQYKKDTSTFSIEIEFNEDSLLFDSFLARGWRNITGMGRTVYTQTYKKLKIIRNMSGVYFYNEDKLILSLNKYIFYGDAIYICIRKEQGNSLFYKTIKIYIIPEDGVFDLKSP